MTAKKATKARRSAGAPSETLPNSGMDDLLELDAAGSLLDELRDLDGVEVGVWRAAGNGNPRDRYLFAVPAQGLSLTQLMDKLRDEYGTGEYRVRGRKGSQFVGSSKTISIEARAGRDLPAPSSAGAVAAAAPPAGLPGMPSVGELLMLMMKQSQDLMLAMVKSPQQQSGLGFGDVLNAAKVMMGQPQTPPASPLAQIREVLELQDLLQRRGGGGDSEEGGWLDLIKSFAAPVAQAALAQAATAAPSAATTVTAPMASPGGDSGLEAIAASAGPAGSTAASGVATGNMAPLVALVGRLVRAAQKDSDPEAYAIFVIDEMGEEAARQLLAQQDALQRLASILPPDLVQSVAQHAEWFREFLEEAKAQLSDAEAGQGVTNEPESVHGAGNDARTPGSSTTAPAAAQQRADGGTAARS